MAAVNKVDTVFFSHLIHLSLFVYFFLILSSEKQNVLVPGSLAHDPSNEQTQSILTSMITKKPQVLLGSIMKSIVKC